MNNSHRILAWTLVGINLAWFIFFGTLFNLFAGIFLAGILVWSATR